LRIALLAPRYWPEVRRGSERLVHDTAVELSRRGHHVTLLVTHPGPAEETVEEGFQVVRMRRPPTPMRMRPYEGYLTSIPWFVLRLARGRFDIAHAFFPSLAWAAVVARRLGGPPVVFSQHGIPTREYLVGARWRLEILQRVLAEAAVVTVLSEAAAEPYRRYLHHEPVIVGGGVDVQAFASARPRDPTPTLICAAALNDARKRGAVLFAAFNRLRRSQPETRLLLAASDDPESAFGGADLPPLPTGVERVTAEDTGVLAGLYASAWASVLPAIEEAFGLVLIESLAAGTPVVAARSGACPEIISDERFGRLFETDDPDDMARAMAEAMQLADQPETSSLARQRAKEFDNARVVDSLERHYEDALMAA
jgi:phosphatidylinositol alpha-mannosyltransferase